MTGTHSGGGLGDSIRKGVGMVHGTGEAIRGNAMSMVDEASGDKASATKNQEIANKGVDEWDRGYRGHPASSGVTPAGADAERERMNTTDTTATNYGSHNSNIGNKVDPRWDSDTDHRGTATASTNSGTHSTNVSNKLDPRFDSDTDHRADPTSAVGAPLPSSVYTDGTDEKAFARDPWRELDETWYPAHEYQRGPNPPHEHRGSIGASSELEAANKPDSLYRAGPEEESMKYTNHPKVHRFRGSISGGSGLQATQKLDPPSEVAAYGPGYSQPDPSYYQPKPTHKSSVLNMLDPDIADEQYEPPKRSTIEPVSQYDARIEELSQAGREQYSSDSDDESERQSRRRSRKFSCPGFRCLANGS